LDAAKRHKKGMKILVVGKGGREHALLQTLQESDREVELFCHPGSDAISELATSVEARGVSELVGWMLGSQVDLCIAGEESYLVKEEGLANLCADAGIPCWGPRKESAMLEASKAFAKTFMQRHEIPTAKSWLCESIEEAHDAIGGQFPTVLKFDGLAAGKGVAVCGSEESANEFLGEVFSHARFGEGKLLVEEYLEGPEVSVFAAVSGESYQIFTPARDYKRIGVGDNGPNTGGMGAVASRQLVEPEMLKRIEEEIVQPTVQGLVKDALDYRGFLYFGLMLTASRPKVIEYNCRFGDPECQAVMPLVTGDLARYCFEGAKGSLLPDLLQLHDGWSVCVVLASAGYPESSRSDDIISGFSEISDARIYHAGTKRAGENWVTNGGRVLSVVATDDSRQGAVEKAHLEAAKVTFEGSQRRKDIGILHF
jgi:phosphoribosylamine--glycine ligase